jgi:hypothetical protein
MSSDIQGLEPFPLFSDSTTPIPNLISKMDAIQLLTSSAPVQWRKSHDFFPERLTNYLRLKYYQYEVTFGLYVMTPVEKLIVNTVILGILVTLSSVVYFGLQPFLVRVICQLIYYITGSCSGVEDLCSNASCS